jgi:hypothetical protein
MRKLFVAISLFFIGTTQVIAYEYPTNETVHYALRCMNELGGQSDENLYTCTCRYDAIRAAMTYSDYEEGYTYERNKKMPGEKGSSFRDNQRAEAFYEQLLKVRKEAEENCIVVKHVELIKPTVVGGEKK